eukprot:COSAG01_NODE_11462_length_1929_cov_1.735519_2_plen_261_part_00
MSVLLAPAVVVVNAAAAGADRRRAAEAVIVLQRSGSSGGGTSRGGHAARDTRFRRQVHPKRHMFEHYHAAPAPDVSGVPVWWCEDGRRVLRALRPGRWCRGGPLVRPERLRQPLHRLQPQHGATHRTLHSEHPAIPLTVIDSPRFPYRGLLIDSARHFLPVSTIKRTLDAMSLAKLNVLHWHLTDDTAFPVQSLLYPSLSAKGAYHPRLVYTQKDLAEVVRHASDRGVRVIPEFVRVQTAVSGFVVLITAGRDCCGPAWG